MASRNDHHTIVAVGDVMPGGMLAEKIFARGIEASISALKALIPPCDLVVGNLECPITNTEQRLQGQLWSLKMPLALTPLLSVFDGVCLANNHILDFDVQGLKDTIKELNFLGIKYCGAGLHSEQARQPAIFEIRGFRVGMMAFTDRNWYPSGESTPGTNAWRRDVSARDVADLSRRSDFVIVQIHSGYEFGDYPGPEELSVTKQAVEAGADLVLCHHSHTLMGIVRKGRAVVAYGLGNFVFDNSCLSHLHKTGRRAVFRFKVAKHEVMEWSVTPCVSDTNGWPLPASDTDKSSIIGHLTRISSVLHDEAQTKRLFRQQAGENMLPHAVRSLARLLRKEGIRPFLARLGRLRWVDFSTVLSSISILPKSRDQKGKTLGSGKLP